MKTTQYIRQEKAIAAADSGGIRPRWVLPYVDLGSHDAEVAAEAKRLMAWLDPGHIYVVEFASGVVKVGKSATPEVRIAIHTKLARAHGGDVVGTWISAEHYCCGEAERELIDFCARFGDPVVGREYFRIPFAHARTYASLVAANRIPTSQSP